MNLIDHYVTEVITRKEVEVEGEPWVLYRVATVSHGYKTVCTLSYPATEEPEVRVGFKFLA